MKHVNLLSSNYHKYSYILGSLKKEHLHVNHDIHHIASDRKKEILSSCEKARMIGNTMLCDRNLPSAITNFDEYIECREKNIESTEKDVSSDDKIVSQSCGKRCNDEAFVYNEKCEKMVTFMKANHSSQYVDRHKPPLDCDKERLIFTQARENLEKGN